MPVAVVAGAARHGRSFLFATGFVMARFHYGGQAVIEGVMMRGQRHMATVIRRPNGELAEDTQPLPAIYTGRLRRVPLLRGVIVLIEALVLGIKTLMYSANVSLEEEGEKVEGWQVWVLVAVSLGAAVAIFFLVPLFVTRLFNIGSTVLFHVIEGLIRLALFIAYLRLIGFMPDIKRVFAYHGAEHKVVNAHEAGVPLEVEAVKGFSTAHVRCGSSFLFAVMMVAIVVFSLIGRPALWLMVLSRVVLVPVIAAVGYEIIYFGARHAQSRLMRVILAPGLWVQTLTTRAPDDRQLEVALAALNRVLEAERREETAVETLP